MKGQQSYRPTENYSINDHKDLIEIIRVIRREDFNE